MTEFHINQRVRFVEGAQVGAIAAAVGGGIVQGYFTDMPGEPEIGSEATEAESDYVVVRVPAGAGRKAFDQWVLPSEIEPEKGMVQNAGHTVH